MRAGPHARPGPARSPREAASSLLALARGSAAAKAGNACTHRQSLLDEPALKEQPGSLGDHRLLRRRAGNCGGRARAARQAPARAAARADGGSTCRPGKAAARRGRGGAAGDALAQNMPGGHGRHAARLLERGGVFGGRPRLSDRHSAAAGGTTTAARSVRPASVQAPALRVRFRALGLAGRGGRTEAHLLLALLHVALHIAAAGHARRVVAGASRARHGASSGRWAATTVDSSARQRAASPPRLRAASCRQRAAARLRRTPLARAAGAPARFALRCCKRRPWRRARLCGGARCGIRHSSGPARA